PRVHPDLAGAVRPVVLGRPAGHVAGADLLPRLVPAQRLRLGVLGPADDRAADRRRRSAPGPAASVRTRRAGLGRPGSPGPAAGPAGPGNQRRLGGGVRPAGPGTARLRAPRPPGAAGAGGAPRRPAAVRGVDHHAAGEGRLLGRDPAALGLLTDRAA